MIIINWCFKLKKKKKKVDLYKGINELIIIKIIKY